MSDPVGVRLAAVELPGSAVEWRALGFAVDADGRVAFANGAITFGAAAPALAIDASRDAAVVVDGPSDVDGVPVGIGAVAPGVDHPNGAFELDHVVLMTDSLDRTSAAVADVLGLEQRRVRQTDTVRQAFHRFDDQGGVRGCIVELAETNRVSGAVLWGLVVNVADLDAACAAAGDLIGPPKDAVQPGRRIATVRRDAGLSTAVALMSP